VAELGIFELGALGFEAGDDHVEVAADVPHQCVGAVRAGKNRIVRR
jgi:hypothetical protein